MADIPEKEPRFVDVRAIVESCIQNTPVIILGSGASAAYGIHTMDTLATALIGDCENEPIVERHRSHWNTFKAAMVETSNLERALETIEANSELIAAITKRTWELICQMDHKVFEKLLTGEKKLALSDTIAALSNGTGPTAHLRIITTNYDRMAEYACEFVEDEFREYLQYTGFSYGLVRRPDEKFLTSDQNVSRRTHRRQDATYASRIVSVEILKVHGSIDWFEIGNDGVFSLPAYQAKPPNAMPSIVTPGKDKYQRTHIHPFSTVLEAARHALESANGYLVCGFGFRDMHVHRNFERRLRTQTRHKPFVVLAKTLTSETKSLFLETDGVNNFVLFEENESGGTIIYKKGQDNQLEVFEIPDSALWDLAEFNREFLRSRR